MDQVINVGGSDRLRQLGSAIFAEVGEWKEEALRQGRDLIDLGIGSPDRPPSLVVRKTLEKAVLREEGYGYPTSEGSLSFREAVADWYCHRFGVSLDPQREVTTLMGSQDGLAHLAIAICNPGDVALVPDPGYPIYSAALVMAGVTAWKMPLREENDYLPQFADIPEDVADKATFMLLNYPSNPISAVADRAFFEHALDYCRSHRIVLVHDLAYSEMAFDGFRPPSVLEIQGAKEVAVEFHSLSKSFNMAGCRLAFLVGHPDVVGALRAFKSNIDYGVFSPVQEAGIAALREDIGRSGHGWAAETYEARRNVFVEAMGEAGWEIPLPKATMFVWARVPDGWKSRQISREILHSTGVVMIPGDAFGTEGAGYVRIALVQPEERLREAAARIGHFLKAVCP